MFSVIVPTYRRPALVREAVDSVLAQTVGDLECIVVDDGGFVPLELPPDRRVRLVRRETNGGLPAARNTGIQHARGRYVTFLDDDDILTPDRLERALPSLQRAAVAVCWVGYLGASDSSGRHRRLDGYVGDVILDHLTPNVGAAVVHRSVIPQFDERFLAIEDVEWWLRLCQLAPVTTVPHVGYLWRRHAGPRHLNSSRARIRFRHLLLEVHRDYFRSHPRAAAFQYRRSGLIALQLGACSEARRYLGQSIALRPDPHTAWHLLRAVRPSRSTEVAG
jgi:glycosyltransferase involved in cell wall biosynthesis